jgi:NitT/TauT family transport system substrate-binding protein
MVNKRGIRRIRPTSSALAGVVILSLLAACGRVNDPKADTTSGARSPVTLTLGYFPNITHAAAVAGVEKGIFVRHLPADVTFKTATFNAGPQAVEALFAGAVDATYIGPNPAINAYVRSHGQAIRIVSGATSGGAALVVRPEINAPADLKGRSVASPQLGNTQDVALRTWLAAQGLKTDVQGGGDVHVVPQENSQTLDTFRSGQIQGAWVPEPWATRLVQEGNGKVLVDEASLWPDGRYVTTDLIVRTEFLETHRDVVKALLEGHLEATDYVHDRRQEAIPVVNEAIAKITGKRLVDRVIETAWQNLLFTTDPIASSLTKSADNATRLRLLEKADLKGIYDLSLLNQVLEAAGRQLVKN